MHGRVICDKGHLVSQCKCINHNEDTVVSHKDGCNGPVVDPGASLERYKPFYAVELKAIAKKALEKTDDPEASENIIVAALRRIEVNTRVLLLNHLSRVVGTGVEPGQAITDAYKQALDEYHSDNFWSGNSSEKEPVQQDQT